MPFGKVILYGLMGADDTLSGPSKGSQDGRQRSNETILIDRRRQGNREDRTVCAWINRYQVRKGLPSGGFLRQVRERLEEPHASFDEPRSSLFEIGGLSRRTLGGSRRCCWGSRYRHGSHGYSLGYWLINQRFWPPRLIRKDIFHCLQDALFSERSEAHLACRRVENPCE